MAHSGWVMIMTNKRYISSLWIKCTVEQKNYVTPFCVQYFCQVFFSFFCFFLSYGPHFPTLWLPHFLRSPGARQYNHPHFVHGDGQRKLLAFPRSQRKSIAQWRVEHSSLKSQRSGLSIFLQSGCLFLLSVLAYFLPQNTKFTFFLK